MQCVVDYNLMLHSVVYDYFVTFHTLPDFMMWLYLHKALQTMVISLDPIEVHGESVFYDFILLSRICVYAYMYDELRLS